MGFFDGEEILVVRGATIAPKEHFLGDELAAGALLFLDDIAAAEEKQGGGLGDGGGAHDRCAGGGVALAADGVGEDNLADLLDEGVVAAEIEVILRSG